MNFQTLTQTPLAAIQIGLSPSRLCWVWMFAVLFSHSLSGQEVAPEISAQQKLDEATIRIRAALKETRFTGAKYFHRPAAEADDWRNRWQRAADDGTRAAVDLKQAATTVLLESDQPSDDVISIASRFQFESFEKAEFEQAYIIANRLFQLNPERMEVCEMAARAALLTNRFAQAKSIIESHNLNVATFPEYEVGLFRGLDTLAENFKQEIELRTSEEAADDLPRVELETTQGKIVLELFEDQAPETVANFIYLVENGFYQNMFFHRVCKSTLTQAVALTGIATPRGPLNPGYNIYDEHDAPNARKHFRGVVSMANHVGVPNTGSASFFLTLVPAPQLDTHHTVFGRVISDIRIMDKIRPTFTVDKEGKDQPVENLEMDSIVSAVVLRKRNHKYEPRRVQSK